MSARWAPAAVALGLLLGSACAPPCPIDLADAGCVVTAACADAGEGLACATAGEACQLCVPATYHSYVAHCAPSGDGGLAWVVSRGVPPMGCPPER